jgi:hypothetical protein
MRYFVAFLCKGEDAGAAFVNAGALNAELHDHYDITTAYTIAANMYRKGAFYDRATAILNDNVIPRLLEAGKHSQAATVCTNSCWARLFYTCRQQSTNGLSCDATRFTKTWGKCAKKPATL